MTEIPASFVARRRERNAQRYAQFFCERLRGDEVVLDCGCGDSALTLGLAECVPNGRVVGIDIDPAGFEIASRAAANNDIRNLAFEAASMHALPFEAESFSACLCHSALETLEDPLAALLEIKRVMKRGALLGAASVDYGGLILAGPQLELLHRFYAARERVWALLKVAAPRGGRDLRALLHRAGFEQVEQHAAYVSHGTSDAVARFGTERAADCRDPWFVDAVTAHDILTHAELTAIRDAWEEWAHAADAFAAFAWCRAVARKP